MYCKNCGTNLRDGVAFCHKCGTQIENLKESAGNVAKEKKNGTKIIVIAVVAIVVLVASTVLSIKLSAGEQTGQNLEPEYKYDEDDVKEDNVSKYITDEGVTSDAEQTQTQTQEQAQTQAQVQVQEYPPPFFESVTATSTLASSGSLTYFANNLIDGNAETAWTEDRSDSGIGEKIIFTSGGMQKVNYIRILNGYCKTPSLYSKNNRVKTIGIVFSDGTSIERTLSDEFSKYNIIALNEPVICNEICFEIQDVYKGTHYDDTCISEIVIE